MREANEPEWITTGEAARVLGLSESQTLPVLKAADCSWQPNGWRRWRRADVLALRDLRAYQQTEPQRSATKRSEYVEPHDFAGRLVARIRAYWAARGFSVEVRATAGGIESDLVDGWPRE